MSITHSADDHDSSDAIATSLSNDRSRRVLRALDDQGTPVHRRVLARQVAASERDATVATVSKRAVDDVELWLHHDQLPRLEDAGFLTYVHGERRVVPEYDDRLRAVFSVQ